MNHPLPPSPAHRRLRKDGWTHDRRVTFCVTLAASGSVTFAAASAGLSRKAAYALRKRDGAFAALWDRSLAAARAARQQACAKLAKGNEVQVNPEPCRRINFIKRRDADIAERDRFFAALESHGPPLAVARRARTDARHAPGMAARGRDARHAPGMAARRDPLANSAKESDADRFGER